MRLFVQKAGAQEAQALTVLLARVNGNEELPAGMVAEVMHWLAGCAIRERLQRERLNLLTDREAQVLHQLAAGLSLHQAADKLGMKERTLRQHMENVKRKVGFVPLAGECHVDVRRVIAYFFMPDIGGCADRQG